MRLLVLPLLLAALPTTAAPPPVVPAPSPPVDATALRAGDRCGRSDFHRAETPGPAEHSKLGDLPPGDTLLAVYRQVDGCLEPVIVRYGDGWAPDAEPVPEPVRPPRARLWR
jgi:hypothetical protein